MDTIIKQITDAGLGVVALAALIYIIVRQLDILKSMNETLSKNNEALAVLKDNIKENTEATRRCTETTIKQIDSQTILSEYFKSKQ